MIKADLHMHSQYSKDCSTSLDKIIKRCVELKINCIALSDHGTAEGALEMQKIAPFKVIVAEEILTPFGEIMGMFLRETVPTNISIEEALSRIKEQGGLVNIPHPYDKLRGLRLPEEQIELLAGKVDLVEVFNAREQFEESKTKARALADKYGLPCSAGSDAHSVIEIGHACVEMPDFTGRDDFLQALKNGKITGHRTNPLIHVLSTWERIKGKIQGK